ncbi:dual specificity protein phosphatase MPK-4 isoform X2 [Tachypleus tridentatus]|uniref:dual specificity protein phosphatase MPK-4 isoform X2 n=1 Tax=Tachypleus tridentatus TaxID=6853 RepID=UPI003FD21787
MSWNEIEHGVYLGNFDAAQDESVLTLLNITHILTIHVLPLKQFIKSDLKYMFIPANDTMDTDLLSWFCDTNSFIKEGQEKGACFVHCFMGISRSATVVIAYLMNRYQLCYEEAYHMVKKKRNCILPNNGFQAQLKLYENMKWKINSSDIQYKLFYWNYHGQELDKGITCFQTYFLQNCRYATEQLSEPVFSCKKCRKVLFAGQNLLPHFRENNPPWYDSRWENLMVTNNDELCKKGLFIEPLPWMVNSIISKKGKLYCPECKSKVGSFNLLDSIIKESRTQVPLWRMDVLGSC